MADLPTAPEIKVPKLIASTGDIYNCSTWETKLHESVAAGSPQEKDPESPIHLPVLIESIEDNFFKGVQWSADGTCLFTNSADNTLRTFIAPTDLLEDHDAPIHLKPYTRIACPEPIYALAPYPSFALSDPTTNLALTSIRDHPTRLQHVTYPGTASPWTYNLICQTTEAYLTPSSLVFTPSGTNFLAGTSCLISLFDISRPGEGPVTRLPTIPSKRHKMKGGGVGMRGIVSCLSLQPTSAEGADLGGTAMLAAGTWTRWVGLYDAEGSGGTVATWDIASAADSESKIGGGGVSQVLWSACGRYLYVVERMSSGILIYDVRVTGRLVGWCENRAAETNQRLGVDVFRAHGGSEIWAGGTDGIVKVWEGAGLHEGGIEADWSWKAHDSAVTGVGVHPTGTVVVTSSGQRRELGPDLSATVGSDEGSSDFSSGNPDVSQNSESSSSRSSISDDDSIIHRTQDNSIKIWSLL